MKALYITDWAKRYEVNDRNRAWSLGEKFRQGALPYYRSKVNGRAWGEGYRAFLRVTSRSTAATMFGIFHKMLEIAADGNPTQRGFLLDKESRPIFAEGLAVETGFAKVQIEKAIEVLKHPDVRWVQERDYVPVPGKPRNLPGIPGDSPSDTESDTDTDTESGVQEKARYTLADARLVLRAYNSICTPSGLAEAIESNGKLNKIKTRLGEKRFREGYENIFRIATNSLFLRGHNDRGWCCDLAWMTKNDENYLKILQGKYANRKGRQKGSAGARPSDVSGTKDKDYNL